MTEISKNQGLEQRNGDPNKSKAKADELASLAGGIVDEAHRLQAAGAIDAFNEENIHTEGDTIKYHNRLLSVDDHGVALRTFMDGFDSHITRVARPDPQNPDSKGHIGGMVKGPGPRVVTGEGVEFKVGEDDQSSHARAYKKPFERPIARFEPVGVGGVEFHDYADKIGLRADQIDDIAVAHSKAVVDALKEAARHVPRDQS